MDTLRCPTTGSSSGPVPLEITVYNFALDIYTPFFVLGTGGAFGPSQNCAARLQTLAVSGSPEMSNTMRVEVTVGGVSVYNQTQVFGNEPTLNLNFLLNLDIPANQAWLISVSVLGEIMVTDLTCTLSLVL